MQELDISNLNDENLVFGSVIGSQFLDHCSRFLQYRHLLANLVHIIRVFEQWYFGTFKIFDNGFKSYQPAL